MYEKLIKVDQFSETSVLKTELSVLSNDAFTVSGNLPDRLRTRQSCGGKSQLLSAAAQGTAKYFLCKD